MNDGRDLEQVVARIEQILAPSGVQVESRDVVVSEDGTTEAELDIVLRGMVGSSAINWLVECRDRPSSGPAPASWIEQLVGRRDRFNFDKVIAVSTTGFSSPAVRYAQEKGIHIRAVTRLEDISDDLFVQNLRWVLFRLEITGECVFRVAESGQEFSFSPENIPLVRLVEVDEESCSLKELIWRFWSHAVAWETDWSSTMFEWVAPNRQYLLAFDHDEEMAADKVSCSIQVDHQIIDAAVPLISLYEEGDREIGRESLFRLPTDDGDIVVRLNGVFDHNTARWMLTIRYPEEIPQNYADHVMIIRPEGFDTGTSQFPLNTLCFTALKSVD